MGLRDPLTTIRVGLGETQTLLQFGNIVRIFASASVSRSNSKTISLEVVTQHRKWFNEQPNRAPTSSSYLTYSLESNCFGVPGCPFYVHSSRHGLAIIPACLQDVTVYLSMRVSRIRGDINGKPNIFGCKLDFHTQFFCPRFIYGSGASPGVLVRQPMNHSLKV